MSLRRRVWALSDAGRRLQVTPLDVTSTRLGLIADLQQWLSDEPFEDLVGQLLGDERLDAAACGRADARLGGTSIYRLQWACHKQGLDAQMTTETLEGLRSDVSHLVVLLRAGAASGGVELEQRPAR